MVFEGLRRLFGRHDREPVDVPYNSAINYHNFWPTTQEAKNQLANLKRIEAKRTREFYESGDVGKDKLLKSCQKKARQYELSGELDNARTMNSFVYGLADNWEQYGQNISKIKAVKMKKVFLADEERVIKKMVGKSDFEGRKGDGGLEKAAATLSVIGLLGAILFLSSNLTGNVIGNLANTTSNWIGGVLFIIGAVGAFVYCRRR